MSSINRGMIFETKDLEQRKLIKEIISKEVLHIPDIKGCMFFNDDEVTSVAYLRYYLYNYGVGDKVEITYIRKGKTLKTTVTLGSNSKTY